MGESLTVDIAIVGGGIAGLWLLNRLRQRGVDAVLLERDRLGDGQTLASQGIIHGGIKYALAGRLTGASEAIAAMPAVWRDCLGGSGDVDLTATRVLSDAMLLWSHTGVGSRLATFLAGHALASPVAAVDGGRPPPFDDARFAGALYRVDELVVDTPSLVQNLRDNCPSAIYRLPAARWRCDGGNAVLEAAALTLRASRFVLTAGAGNREILTALGSDHPQMQLRPLQQVLVRHTADCPLYGHCIQANATAGPRLTVTTHYRRDGTTVWYLGGELATKGAGMTSAALIDRARAELAAALPWVDLGGAEWATLAVDRAEVARRGLLRPDTAFAEPAAGIDNVIVGWPTKLALAPLFARRVEHLIEPLRLSPAASTALPLAPAAIAAPVWETAFGQAV